MKKPAKKNKNKPIKPVGRPTDYKPEYNQIALNMFKQGATVAMVAKACGTVRRARLYDWAAKCPEFKYTLEHGQELAEAWFDEQGIEAINSRKPFRENMWKFYMAVRFGKRDKQEIINTNLDLKPETQEENNDLVERIFKTIDSRSAIKASSETVE